MRLISLLDEPTVMDKSLGTNLYLWRFLHAPNKSIYTCSAPPRPIVQCYFSRVSRRAGWGGGGVGEATHFKTDNSAFLNLRFKNTEN